MTRLARVAMAMLFLSACAATSAEEPVRVFAAASLTNVLTEIASQWQERGHPLPRLAFGGTATLARQLAAGAPADFFAAADGRWMDELGQQGLLEPGTRVDLLGNELVLIAPTGRQFQVELRPGFAFASAFTGKLCLGEPGVVPAGTYAKQSLESLQWWDSLQGRLVGTEDVRAALAFVERGECAAGIVYATDAAVSRKVVVIARFAAQSHASIVYPVALLRNASPQAHAFLQYLGSNAAVTTFRRHGFVPLSAGH
ncbi:MAG: molybdate transporter substrate-binding protein, partial [Pseudomonadota bacterium]|jgi:molybdate transport system substrate-binding protein